VGDRRWLALLRQHNAIVRTAVAAQRGFEVKTVGDAFMLAFRSAGDALQCAAELQRELAASGLPIHVRIGIHTGEPAQLGTDYYGHHINLAARITATAAAGEVLVSSVVRSLVDASGVFEFTPCAPVQFDGIAGTHQLYRLTWVRSTTGE
jgi:class 3 adenylate cyclase